MLCARETVNGKEDDSQTGQSSQQIHTILSDAATPTAHIYKKQTNTAIKLLYWHRQRGMASTKSPLRSNHETQNPMGRFPDNSTIKRMWWISWHSSWASISHSTHVADTTLVTARDQARSRSSTHTLEQVLITQNWNYDGKGDIHPLPYGLYFASRGKRNNNPFSFIKICGCPEWLMQRKAVSPC